MRDLLRAREDVSGEPDARRGARGPPDDLEARMGLRQDPCSRHTRVDPIAGAARDSVGLAAHRSEAACPTCSPTSAPFPETRSSRWGRPELSYLDNASAYRSAAHALAGRNMGTRHILTRL
jgi:hypothetical protein